MIGPDHHQRAVVIHLRKAQTSVLLGHLHTQRAKFLEPGNHLIGDPPLGLNRLRIDLGLQKRAKSGQEPLPLLDSLGRKNRLRGNQLRLEMTEVQPLTEARQLPLLLPSRLRDRSSFFVAGVSGHACTSVIGVAALGIRGALAYETQGPRERR